MPPKPVKPKKTKPESKRPKHLFDGKIFCGQCGRRFGRAMSDTKDGGHLYWYCRAKSTHGITCDSVNYPDTEIRDIFCKVMGKKSFDEDYFTKVIDRMVVQASGSIDFHLKDGSIRTYETLKLRSNKHETTSTDEFTGKIVCASCGNTYLRYCGSGKYVYWRCSGKHKVRTECSGQDMADFNIRKVTAYILGMDDFDGTSFTEQIDRIKALEDERLNKGISIEHTCDSPYLQGWKLEMIAEKIFERYIENADKVMNLSYSMLEKHIADQEALPDNADVIQRKQSEIDQLAEKRSNLIEMRAEGDIDKGLFRCKRQEIDDRIAKLTEEIGLLQPEKEQISTEDYTVKLQELRDRLKEYTGFEYSVIPESVVEAFIERIWVSKDEFRWYLRTGKSSGGAFEPDDHIKIGSFTLTIDDAKKYIYSFSTRRRVYKWVDLNVSVWV